MMDKKSGFLQKKYLNKPAFQPNVKKALMRYPVSLILKTLVSHRFTLTNPDKTLCCARLALHPIGVTKN